MRTHFWRIALVVLLFVLSGCTSNTGLPSRTGDYSLQQGSVCVDGDRYQFGWVDEAGNIHQADAKVTSVTRDDRSYLQLQGNNQSTLHLSANESVPVCPNGQNRSGWTSWIPIPIPSGGPVFQRPGDSGTSGTNGSQPSDNKPSLGIPKTAPNPFGVGGQSGGTGGGTAAGGKSVAPSSGQSGGTGVGGAATGKGLFGGGGSSGGSAPKITIPKVGGGRSFGGGKH